MERDPDVCIVTCALTGVLANRSQCPYVLGGIPATVEQARAILLGPADAGRGT